MTAEQELEVVASVFEHLLEPIKDINPDLLAKIADEVKLVPRHSGEDRWAVSKCLRRIAEFLEKTEYSKNGGIRA